MDEDLNSILQGNAGRPDSNLINQIVTRSKPFSLADVAFDPNTNAGMSPDLYTSAKAKFREFPDNMVNASGMVFPQAKNTIFVDKSSKEPNTVTHESAHVQQKDLPYRLWNPKDIASLDVNDPDYLGKMKSLTKILDLEKSIRDKSTQLKENRGDDVFNKKWPVNMDVNIRELGATLQALEGSMPKGHSIWNHPQIKNRFTPQEQAHINMYMIADRSKLSEIPEGDPIQKKKEMDWWQGIQQHIRNWTAK